MRLFICVTAKHNQSTQQQRAHTIHQHHLSMENKRSVMYSLYARNSVSHEQRNG